MTREDLVMELAFAIEDPCGLDEIALARAAVEFVVAVAPAKRREVAVTFAHLLQIAKVGTSLRGLG
jgi:hypothetical protein